MGERSKTIGEIGENIVGQFFSLIGWENPLENQSLKCMKPKKHARKESKTGLRQTHGIDYLHCYKSPLESNTIESALVSVKHSEEKYQNNPKSKFKEYIEDLSYSLECYKNSELKSEQLQKFRGVTRNKDTGVIFWLSSSDDTYDDLVSKISNTRLDQNLRFESIHIVDNQRIGFIYDVMTWLRANFDEQQIYYYYPETSLSYVDKSILRSGKVLPVEFLTSPILPIQIKGTTPDEQDTFCIACMDGFEQDGVRRLIQAAREYTNEVSCNYLFLFPNYINSHHSDLVSKAKVGFDTKITSKLTIESYRPDYRSLNRG